MLQDVVQPLVAAPYAPINFIYTHFHNVIRAELDALAAKVRSLEGPTESDIELQLQELKDRYRFLEQVYKYHSAVEDEVSTAPGGDGPPSAASGQGSLSNAARFHVHVCRLCTLCSMPKSAT